MFYGADEVETALKCAFCDKKLVNEVKLVPECGCFICGECYMDARKDATETGTYKCEACKETHSMPDSGLPDCKQLLPLLKSQPFEKPLTETAKKLKILVKEVVEQMEKLEAFDDKECLNEHCDRLEQDVRETVASAVEHLSKIEAELLSEISVYRTRCLDEAVGSAKQDLDALSVKVQEFNAQWSRYFSRLDVMASEADINASLGRVDCFRAEMLMLERRLKEEALGGQLLVFKPYCELFRKSDAIGKIVNLTQRELRINDTPIRTLTGHTGSIWSVVHLSHDRVASCSDDKTILVWDIKDSKELFKLEGHTGPVYSLATLHSGLLASGSNDYAIKIWDLEKRKEIRTLQAHKGSVVSFCLLKNGNLASFSNDNTIRVWNPYVSENNLLLTISGHGHSGWNISIGTMENGSLVTCSRDTSDKQDAILRIWNANDGQLVKEVSTGLKAARSLVVLQDDRVAIGFNNGSIRIVDLENDATSMTKEQAHDSSINALAQLSNENLISYGQENSISNRTIKIWALSQFALLKTLDTGHLKNVLSLSISSDETSLATTGEDSTIKLWTITH